MAFDWNEFFDRHGKRPGLSDFIVSSTGIITAMVGKEVEFLEQFEAGKGIFENLLTLIFGPKLPELGLDALEPAANIGERRYRVSYYRTLRGTQLTLRLLPQTIRSPSELRIPQEVVDNFIEQRGGLFLFSGDMGSGKSSSVASLCSHLAEHQKQRFFSIEDPVEFVHPEILGKSTFDMREVGTSCSSYEDALREIRRQHATVVMVGEIRSAVTAETCVRLSLIGIKVCATIHGDSVPATAAALVAELPKDREHWARANLAQACRMIVSQRLLRHPESGDLVAVHEVLFNIKHKTTSVEATIREGSFDKLRREIENHRRFGMRTFETSINDACNDGLLPAEMRPDSKTL